MNSQSGANRIRLATYNIHSSIGRDGRRDLGRIARVIGEFAADVVALQEVDSRHGSLDTLAFLSEQTGMTALAGPTLLRKDGTYGNALLTNRPLLDLQRVDLSFARREPRGALDIRLAASDKCVRVVATHLGLRPAERRSQINRLLAQLDRDPAGLTVLMGDLNEWFLWGRPLRRLHAHFGQTPAPATFPSHWPLFALDRIWVEPLHQLRHVTVHDSQLARRASDHLPLVAEITV